MATGKRTRTTAAELRIDTSKLPADMRRGLQYIARGSRQMQRQLNSVESPMSRMGGGAVARGNRQRRMGGMMGGVGQTLKGAAVFGGVYSIGAEIKKAKQFEEVLVDIAVRGSKNKRWMDEARSSMLALSSEYGIGKDQLADYVGTVIDQTGNTELAMGTLRSMTAVAFSANVPMKELAGTVVEMQSKLALSPDQFETGLGILAAQADKGKIPLSQMSKFLPEVLNATTQFGHTGIPALREYGAVLQMAARGAGSLAEANTAMNRMLDQTAAKRGKIEKTLGVKLKKNGMWLGLADMLKEIVRGLIRMKAAGKDVEGYVTKVWGIRGKKAILPLMQQGMTGFGKRVGAKGGKGGLTSFNDLIAAGGAGTIQGRVARKRQLSPELDAWNKSVEKLKNKLHMHLLPAINKLGEVIPEISTALGWMIDNWKLLLVIWGSTKMLRFFNALGSVAGGGGRVLGGLLGAGGGGGGAATSGLGGTGLMSQIAGSTAGGGGLVAGLSTATVALGAFAASIAPAVAGLHQIAKAYDKGEQKKLRDRLTKESREGPVAWMREQVDQARGFTGIDAGPKTFRAQQEIVQRKRFGLSEAESGKLRGAYKEIQAGRYEEGRFGAAQVGEAKVRRLRGASDYELGLVGLTRDTVDALVKAMSDSPSQLAAQEARFKEFEAFTKRTAKLKVQVEIVDPAKTAKGMTDSRRGRK
jgi:hypothetical protein